jgi:dihydrofolate reductase
MERLRILGGTEIFGLFLPRYDVFHLSRVAGLRLPHIDRLAKQTD